MRCSKCGAENPGGKKFCGDCGAAVENHCPQCGADNPPAKRFCGNCGAALLASSTPTPSSSPAQATAEVHTSPALGAISATDGERRHLTVLFSDLVGSTEISARLDPEDWREIAAQYQRTAAAAVTRFGGHVAKYLGDGLMVYFGWPEAHEDDAERGVRAGLALVDNVRALNGRLAAEYKVKLSVRVGIETGSVVMGRGGGEGADVFGDAPNVASRVQSAAEPDSVLITAGVHRLVSGQFVVEDHGAHQLKGIDRPVLLYRAIQPAVTRRRTRPTARIQTPFVGRDDDMQLLLSRWERARDGQGQLVLVTGEPGIGKSRLIEELRAHIRDDPHVWVECAGDHLFQTTPFHAIRQILDQGLGWSGDESPEERLTQLELRLERAGLRVAEAVPLIAEMLSLPIPDKYPPLLFAPEQKRKRLLANLAGWVLNGSRVQPMVMAMEDLHWIDPSTLELTHTLVEQAVTAPFMLLFAARPEFRAPWPMRAHHTQITLNRLNKRHTREMVAGLVARSALAPDLVDAVVRRTDGVPLFAEELSRLILEGDGRSVVREIPATLHDSLAARLDRLGPAKEVAQVAAVIGREFSYELLRAVAPANDQELQSALQKLVDAELIYARGIPPEATYQFKHALIHDAAYEALLKSRRRELHRSVVVTIVEKFPEVAEARPEVLARHWTEAGEPEPAVAAWTKAGSSADARRAFREAGQAYEQALAVLSHQPQSPERDMRDLELCSALFRVRFVTRGYSAPESVEAAARARNLVQKTSDLAQLCRLVYGNWSAVIHTGDYSGAAALADQLLDFAPREGSPATLGFAHMAQMQTRYYQGDLVGAKEHFVRGSDFVESAGFREFPGAFVIAMGFAGINAWTLGYAASARELIVRALAFGHDSENPYDLATARFFESWLHSCRREPELAEAASAQALAIDEAHDFSYGVDLTHCLTGWARAQRGRAGDGVELLRKGLAGLNKIGTRIGFSYWLTLLAESQVLDGNIASAFSTLEDALQTNPEEIVFQPSILTCRGDLRLKTGQSELAEADFREATTLAQKMQAKNFELRATTSLARLLRDTNRRVEAHAMLAEIYNWFTEGFDTADLKDAKALLEELNNSSR
jgi:class 3 adenylate cyclase/tetratricopeptide (TPR) repeat protein